MKMSVGAVVPRNTTYLIERKGASDGIAEVFVLVRDFLVGRNTWSSSAIAPRKEGHHILRLVFQEERPQVRRFEQVKRVVNDSNSSDENGTSNKK